MIKNNSERNNLVDEMKQNNSKTQSTRSAEVNEETEVGAQTGSDTSPGVESKIQAKGTLQIR